MKTSILAVAALLVCSAVQADTIAQTCSKHSPAHTVALLELYTSEGCDSCPPADTFVSGLRGSGMTSEQVVPLSMHVDYWDYIGWKDLFAKAAFTERQRWLSNNAGSRTIYTPELFIGGHELRGGVGGWRGAVPAAVKRINDRPARADISIALGRPAAGNLPVEVSAITTQDAQSGKLFVAVVENGLRSVVKAGENRGVTLKHDYVVRQWLGPIALADRKASLVTNVPLPSGATAGNLGVVAFLQSNQGEILQALMQPLCGG
ncbi:DUF1223 domain-containing protein [Undibacterium arcticum]|uniref:DUF1223 domain-containing protein n=1 Tax=Undibacterium arcticum TaxID=1762892 RepID=A0ABV7EWV4_9BURK